MMLTLEDAFNRAADPRLINENSFGVWCPTHPKVEVICRLGPAGWSVDSPCDCGAANLVKLGLTDSTSTNGTAPHPSQFQWKNYLYERAVEVCDQMIAADPLNREMLAAFDLDTFHATLNNQRNKQGEWQSSDPEGLSETEIQEEIEVIARALQTKYAGEQKPEKPKAEPKPKAKGLLTVKEYLIEYAGKAEQPYLLEEMLYRGTFNLLLGRPYSGKSSIAASLLRSIALGETFLGRRCRESVCAYLALERNGVAVAKLFETWSLSDSVHFGDEIPVQKAANYIYDEIKRLKLQFLVIDHLQHVTHIKKGNEYAEVSNALKPYQDIAKNTGCCILALHHQGKGKADNENPEEVDDTLIEALGSEAYRAASDALMEATTFRHEYFLRGQPRAGTDMPRTHIEIDFDTGETIGTAADQADIDIGIEAVMEFLRKVGDATEKEIRTKVTGSNRVIAQAIRQGVKDGKLARTGKGIKAEPYKYTIGLVYR